MKAHPALSRGTLFLKWSLNHKRLRTKYKANYSWINTFLWVLPGFCFFAWLEMKIHACLRSRTRLFGMMLKRERWMRPAVCLWNMSGIQAGSGVEDYGRATTKQTSALILPRNRIPLRHHINYSTMRSSLAGGWGGVLKMLQHSHISQPHSLPTIQACGAGQASKTGVHSTTISPSEKVKRGSDSKRLLGWWWGGPFPLYAHSALLSLS